MYPRPSHPRPPHRGAGLPGDAAGPEPAGGDDLPRAAGTPVSRRDAPHSGPRSSPRVFRFAALRALVFLFWSSEYYSPRSSSCLSYRRRLRGWLQPLLVLAVGGSFASCPRYPRVVSGLLSFQLDVYRSAPLQRERPPGSHRRLAGYVFVPSSARL